MKAKILIFALVLAAGINAQGPTTISSEQAPQPAPASRYKTGYIIQSLKTVSDEVLQTLSRQLSIAAQHAKDVANHVMTMADSIRSKDDATLQAAVEKHIKSSDSLSKAHEDLKKSMDVIAAKAVTK